MENDRLRKEPFTNDKKAATITNTGAGGTSGVPEANCAREAIEAFPKRSMRPALHIVLGSESIVSMRTALVCSEDRERLYREDKLGCARGVFWVLVFQVVTVVAVAVCWSLYILLR